MRDDGQPLTSPDYQQYALFRSHQQLRASLDEEVKLLNRAFALSGLLSLPRIPKSNRSLEQLLKSDMFDVWNLSASERGRLHDHWTQEYRDTVYETHGERLDSLLKKHRECRNMQEEREEAVSVSCFGETFFE